MHKACWQEARVALDDLPITGKWSVIQAYWLAEHLLAGSGDLSPILIRYMHARTVGENT